MRLLVGLICASLAAIAPAQSDAPVATDGWIVVVEPVPMPSLRPLIAAGDAQQYADAWNDASAATAGRREALRTEVRSLGGSLERWFWPFQMAHVRLTDEQAEAVRRIAWVTRVERDQEHAPHIKKSTNAANHNADWVHASAGWTGGGSTLGLLDSGINGNCCGTGSPHPAFDGPTGSTRVVQQLGAALPGDTEDQRGHGTSVAGMAAARRWANQHADDGFAPDVGIASYKLTTGANNTHRTSDLLQALTLLSQDRVRLDIDVANLSFAGSPGVMAPASQALDAMPVLFDVLVVTSAGNGGFFSQPTFRSHSNANGLAVGAVHADTHRVWDESSMGPLLGDTRHWPDLVAVGVGLRTPPLNDPSGDPHPVSGTSFAAPAVAGTALLLRAARPELTALDTKALILNHVEDLSAQNPGLSRFEFGLGLLRTDLAVQGTQSAQIVRGQISPNDPAVQVPFSVIAGKSYAATLAWQRVDVTKPAWDNLDLVVINPTGKVVARSANLRDLYERALFDSLVPGTYQLLIEGTDVLHANLDWTLVVSENLGGGRQIGEWTAFGHGCAGTALDPTQGTQLPGDLTGQNGNTRLTLPFGAGPSRLLQIFDGSWIPAGQRITALAWRRDEDDVGSSTFSADVDIRISYTSGPPYQLSTTFDNNIGKDVQTVLNRNVEFPGTFGRRGGPADYDFVLVLDQPFVTKTNANKHLLIDMRVTNHVGRPPRLLFDAHIAGNVAIVYNIGNPGAAVGTGDPMTIPFALLTGATSSRIPHLELDGTPQLGGALHFVLRDATPNCAASLIYGGFADTWGSAMLPYDLTNLGAPGCSLFASSELVVPANVGANGQATLPFSIPNLPSLTGDRFYSQFVVLDPAANALGVTLTPAGAGRIGG